MFLSEVAGDAIARLTADQLRQVLDLAALGYSRRRVASLVGVHVRQIPTDEFAVARRRGRFFRETRHDVSQGLLPPHGAEWPPGQSHPNGVIYTP